MIDVLELKDRARFLDMKNVWIDNFYIEDDFKIRLNLFKYLGNMSDGVIELPEGIDYIDVRERETSIYSNTTIIFPSSLLAVVTGVTMLGYVDFRRDYATIFAPNLILDFRKCDKLKAIAFKSFRNCSFKGLYFGEIKEIGAFSFENCNLETLKLIQTRKMDILGFAFRNAKIANKNELHI